jgi:hypothetical protein
MFASPALPKRRRKLNPLSQDRRSSRPLLLSRAFIGRNSGAASCTSRASDVKHRVSPQRSLVVRENVSAASLNQSRRPMFSLLTYKKLGAKCNTRNEIVWDHSCTESAAQRQSSAGRSEPHHPPGPQGPRPRCIRGRGAVPRRGKNGASKVACRSAGGRCRGRPPETSQLRLRG